MLIREARRSCGAMRLRSRTVLATRSQDEWLLAMAWQNCHGRIRSATSQGAVLYARPPLLLVASQQEAGATRISHHAQLRQPAVHKSTSPPPGDSKREHTRGLVARTHENKKKANSRRWRGHPSPQFYSIYGFTRENVWRIKAGDLSSGVRKNQARKRFSA